MIRTLLVKSSHVAFDVADKFFFIRKISFPYERTVAKHPHGSIYDQQRIKFRQIFNWNANFFLVLLLLWFLSDLKKKIEGKCVWNQRNKVNHPEFIIIYMKKTQKCICSCDWHDSQNSRRIQTKFTNVTQDNMYLDDEKSWSNFPISFVTQST